MKVCSKCHIEKDESEFRFIYKDKSHKYRYRTSWCRGCELAYKKYWRRKNGVKERINRRTKEGKICCRCLTEKPLDCFSSKRSNQHGNPYCKSCYNVVTMECRAKRIEHYRSMERKIKRKRFKADPMKIREWNRKWCQKARDGLWDGYIIKSLNEHYGVPKTQIRLHPEIIELQRNIIKIKRELCNKQSQPM